MQQIWTKSEASERDVETGIREGTYGLAIGLGRELSDEAYTASVFVEGWIVETQIPFWHCRKTRLHDTQKRCSCRTFQVLPPELAAAAPPPPPPLPLTSVASNSIVLFPKSHVPGGSLQQVAGSIDCRRGHQSPAGGSTTLVLGGGGKACCGGWRDDAAAAACCLTTAALSSWWCYYEVVPSFQSEEGSAQRSSSHGFCLLLPESLRAVFGLFPHKRYNHHPLVNARIWRNFSTKET